MRRVRFKFYELFQSKLWVTDFGNFKGKGIEGKQNKTALVLKKKLSDGIHCSIRKECLIFYEDTSIMYIKGAINNRTL